MAKKIQKSRPKDDRPLAEKIKNQKSVAQRVTPVKVVQGNFINTLLVKFSPENIKNYRPSKGAYLVILIVGVLLLATFKKGWFVAAMVNGQPITNLELQAKMNQQFRAQTLDQMISEKIILDEANKNNALASEGEVNNKLAEIETSVGGVQAFNNLLSQQGQTVDNVKHQLKIQLSIEKLYASVATVSADEVSKYIETNKDTLQATDSASQEKEVENILKQQKLSQTFQAKFQELRTQAKIQIF